MSYQGFTKRSALNVILVLLVSLLVACGGGGGGSKPTPTPIPTLAPTPVPDTTPEPFSFTLPAVSPEAGATVTLDALTITGLDAAAIITISGGEYAIDGGAFTALQGIIENSQSLQVQAVASSNFSGEVDVTVTIGGVIESFTLTTIAEDTTPEAFSFSAVTDAALGATVSSNTVTITGLNSPAPVSITGGDYAIGSGTATATNLGGTITNGQTLTLSITAAATFSTATTATVTVGGVTAGFVVTTLAQDTTPDVFSFTDAADVEFSLVEESGPITVTGINDGTPISITGGEYAIAGGAFTAAGGMVTVGQSVVVRGTAPALPSETQDVVLLIGGIADTFSISTPVDNSAPTVELYFPTQLGLTDKTTLRVRGVAEDELSEITSVIVNGLEVETDDNYTNWQVSLPLTESAETEIVVTATDAAGNTSDAQVLSTVTHRSDLSEAFNVADPTMYRFAGLQFMDNYEKLFVMEERRNFHFMDPNTGAFTLLSTAEDPDTHNDELNSRTYSSAYYPHGEEKRMFVSGKKGIFSVDLESGVRTLVSDVSYADETLPFERIYELTIFAGATLADSYLLATDVGGQSLVKVDIATGAKTLFSDHNDAALGDAWGDGVVGLYIDQPRNRVLISADRMISLDLTTGMRTFVADRNLPNDDVTNPNYTIQVSLDGSEAYSFNLTSGIQTLAKVSLTEGDEFGIKTQITQEQMPGLGAGARSLAIFHERDVAYKSTYSGIGIIDILTGEQVVLLKVAN
ncbi:hypothetical protein [Teredinibacter haidensis]|uniref:hypothetical protein n=1 Tax=Teredinibacter haidensis TaxID=2731755 RepID=UPI00163CD9EA|nr:hypothetical protein [Teredinibacter haidensis]